MSVVFVLIAFVAMILLMLAGLPIAVVMAVVGMCASCLVGVFASLPLLSRGFVQFAQCLGSP
ncbi:hypothetical protein, partial [Pseudomonas sp.]|uniref:hypothetical protein n=1 Tax=Pseudomonas sp. TaxID=306 RepID=UPI00257B4734